LYFRNEPAWAIDLALGRVTRPHAAVDNAVFRGDQAELRAAVSNWHFEVVVDGVLAPWEPDRWLALPVHELQARPLTTSGPGLEFLLNERDGSDWAYRRDPRVRLPLTRALRRRAGEVLLLAPEVVLLYKSNAPRGADEQDFRSAQPLLDSAARVWPQTALVRRTPNHQWATALASVPNDFLS
jgi:hypothetical protein